MLLFINLHLISYFRFIELKMGEVLNIFVISVIIEIGKRNTSGVLVDYCMHMPFYVLVFVSSPQLQYIFYCHCLLLTSVHIENKLSK